MRPRSAAPRLITLLTDFGLKDSYVGAMKGVIASIAPAARVVDISHEIPPQDIRRAGIVWADAVRWFPEGCVHVAVVDPGVGSRRKIIAFEARGSVFLAPDNGLVGYVLARSEIRRTFEVKRRELFLEPVSATFHGRDVFAPVAARLATGLALDAVGPACRTFRVESLPQPRLRARGVRGARRMEARGEVLYVDGFGNAVTNIVPRESATLETLAVGGRLFRRFSRTYGDVGVGEPLALVGSSGRIEVAVNGGSAASDLRLRAGDPVVVLWR